MISTGTCAQTPERLTPEAVAQMYWHRMRRAGIWEVETKLAQMKEATPATLSFWLEVHTWLEKKGSIK